jgi:hypothetical protein
MYGRTRPGLPFLVRNADTGAGGGATPPPADPPPAAEPPADDKPLGPEGEKALAAWKDRAKTAEAAVKALPTLQAELDALRQQTMTDHEKAVADARKEADAAARAEVLGTVNTRLFAAELKAASTGKLTDPDLLADTDVALKLLGLDEIPTTQSGDIDAAAIAGAVAKLIEQKPYLASATQTPGSADLGARTTATTKTLDQQIQEAEAAQDWATARRLKLLKQSAK